MTSQYLVGELGPEEFRPTVAGSIIPNEALESELAVLTSHHRDCASGWAMGACDCGYAEQMAERLAAGGSIVRECSSCTENFEQPAGRRGRPRTLCDKCRGV